MYNKGIQRLDPWQHHNTAITVIFNHYITQKVFTISHLVFTSGFQTANIYCEECLRGERSVLDPLHLYFQPIIPSWVPL